MRVFLFDTLAGSTDLQAKLGFTSDAASARAKIKPRESASNINIVKPYLVYGIGNATNEDLAEDTDHEAYRQFFQIWVHDEGGSYQLIDDTLEILKNLLVGQTDPSSKVSGIRWLENSQEFSNETLNTIFRYARFQAIISKGQ
jgi:hypothetical protein